MPQILNITLSLAALTFCMDSMAHDFPHSFPQRILPLSPALLEITGSILGKETNRLVGTTQNGLTLYPKLDLQSVGPYHRPNLEGILKAKPDLVIATRSGNPPNIIQRLKEMKINVLIVNSENLSQIRESIKIIAQKLGKLEVGIKIQKIFDDKFKALKNKKERLGAFLQFGDQPIVTAGRGSFVSEVLERSGGKNIFSDLQQTYPKISEEEVIKRNPSHIFIFSFGGNLAPFQKMKKRWLSFKKLKAVQNGNIHIVDSTNALRPSHRIWMLAEIFDRYLHGVGGVEK